MRNKPFADLGLASRNEETAIPHSDLVPSNHGKPACPRTAERLSRRVPIAGQNLCGEKHDPKRNFLQRRFANPGIYGPVVILQSSGDRRDAPNRGTVTLSLDFVNIVSLLLVLNRDSYEAPKLWESQLPL